MNKLKCFRCGNRFVSYSKYHKQWKSDQIYRNEFNEPVCRSCLLDQIDQDWEEPERILEWLSEYNFSYAKYRSSLFEVICPKCKSINAIDKTNSDTQLSCFDCHSYLVIEHRKVVQIFKNEDEYYQLNKNERCC